MPRRIAIDALAVCRSALLLGHPSHILLHLHSNRSTHVPTPECSPHTALSVQAAIATAETVRGMPAGSLSRARAHLNAATERAAAEGALTTASNADNGGADAGSHLEALRGARAAALLAGLPIKSIDALVAGSLSTLEDRDKERARAASRLQWCVADVIARTGALGTALGDHGGVTCLDSPAGELIGAIERLKEAQAEAVSSGATLGVSRAP